MLFVLLLNVEPSQTPESGERRLEKGIMLPEGIKLIGEWSAASGGRYFAVINTDDVYKISDWCGEWNDIGKWEVIPVFETEEWVKRAKSQ